MSSGKTRGCVLKIGNYIVMLKANLTRLAFDRDKPMHELGIGKYFWSKKFSSSFFLLKNKSSTMKYE